MNTTDTQYSGLISANKLTQAVLSTFIVIVVIFGAYYQTTLDMVTTWWRSETYAHGFLIFPFSAYMLWNKRDSISSVAIQPNYWILLILCGLGAIWLIARLASVQVVEQYALIAMIPVIVGVILGHRMFLATAFPLLYLFFAVPFGDVLIPPLIDFTSDFTVGALQLTGIPVYREGTFFSLPSGNWSVVEACSGLRYLIASVTLGTLYAYLTYISYTRRFWFILLAIIVPIIANGIRAYLIVMTGHFSGMKLAVGVDHLIYGWVFFGLVMLLLFWLGSFWREDQIDEIKDKDAINPVKIYKETPLTTIIFAACITLFIALAWPAYAVYLEKNNVQDINPQINIALSLNSAQDMSINVPVWEPKYIGTPIKDRQIYLYKGKPVRLYVTYYYNQTQDNELINSGNLLGQKGDVNTWRIIDETERNVSFDLKEVTVTQNLLHTQREKLLVWRWFWINGEETANPFLAKALLSMNKLFNEGDMGAEIIVAAPYEDRPSEAVPVLQQFIKESLPAIRDGLVHAYR